ncbi:protein phosphatase 2C domain-containing protein [Mycobacterium barrassiae]|uniref:protein phosphatase 2C domain-containing protein n=1 Tax=Mycobacterium barrassiae TaxID=319709 RepID=UPI002265E6B4|nr:protein phosphatase 2C domain-containing protein [Mycobacterium barrassiae]MCV7303514.1 protein phosphatase 2C domain-containing protein [Mycobacterium barrassiae]
MLPQGPLAYLNIPKIADEGEDADPLFHTVGQTQWIGVFDGLGGAGATVYNMPDGHKRSGAYIASRVACAACARWVEGEAPQATPGKRAIGLRDALMSRFAEAKNDLAEPTSRLRGRLIKALPTTLALAGIHDVRQDHVECDVLWAGDSRVYYITPDEGLVQISVDQLKEPLDAQENLTADSPMSNCIAADEEFYIDEIFVTLKKPLIVLAATDGCFGYVPTPTHFEHVLLSAMVGAETYSELQTRLRESISSYTADDASIAMTHSGWETYGSLKSSFKRRMAKVEKYVDAFDKARLQREQARDQLREADIQFAHVRDKIWAEYRQGYEPKFERTRTPL